MTRLLPFCPVLAFLAVASAGDRPGPSGLDEGRPGVEARAALADRFEREIWPMIVEPEDAGKACLACHRDDQANTSPLIFSGDPDKDFDALAAGGYFDRGNPESLLARIASKSARRRMPPEPQPAWSKREIDRLRSFNEAFHSAVDEAKRSASPESRP